MENVPKDLGQRIVEIARMAALMHLERSLGSMAKFDDGEMDVAGVDTCRNALAEIESEREGADRWRARFGALS